MEREQGKGGGETLNGQVGPVDKGDYRSQKTGPTNIDKTTRFCLRWKKFFGCTYITVPDIFFVLFGAYLSRESAVKWWLAIGVLMMAFATCWAATTEMDNDATMMSRQTRGLVLRSWRGAQHTENQGTEKNPPTKSIEPIKPSPREAMVLAGLPISMRLVLLQRLTGYDKRTPNSKAFLGMRGKKSSFWPATEVQEEELPELQGSSENGNSNSDDLEQLLYGHVPEKKKEKFLGMRGKKVVDPQMEPVALPYWRERNVFQQPFQQVNSKKRAPSSNSFMGMRGKRSGLVEDKHLPDKKTGQEQPVNGSKFSPRYDERLFACYSKERETKLTCCSYNTIQDEKLSQLEHTTRGQSR